MILEKKIGMVIHTYYQRIKQGKKVIEENSKLKILFCCIDNTEYNKTQLSWLWLFQKCMVT